LLGICQAAQAMSFAKATSMSSRSVLHTEVQRHLCRHHRLARRSRRRQYSHCHFTHHCTDCYKARTCYVEQYTLQSLYTRTQCQRQAFSVGISIAP